MIYVFLFVVITTLIRVKFCTTTRPYVMMSLPYMTSSSFTLRLFIGWFRHKYLKYSCTTVWILLLCFKYLLSFILLVFWFRRSNSNSEIWYILQIHFTKKKLYYPDPQLLRQCKFLNCHHGGQLTTNQYFVCYYIVCLLIQPLRPTCPLPRLCCIIRCRLFRAHPGICGEGGRENLATGHKTWERAEVVGEVVRGVGATENHPHPPRPIGGNLLQNVAHKTLHNPHPQPRGGGWDCGTWERAEVVG